MSKKYTRLHADIQEEIYQLIHHWVWADEAEERARKVANKIISLIDKYEKDISQPKNA